MLHSIRTKVLVTIISITLVTALAITMIFYFKSAQMIEDNYSRNMLSRVEQVGKTFDEAAKEIYYVTVQASCDSGLQGQILSYLQSKDEQILEETAELLNNYKRHYSDIGSIYLVLPREQMIVTSEDYPIYEKGIEEAQLDPIINSAATPVVLEDPLRASSFLLSFISQIEDGSGNVIGYIMSNMKERTLYYKYLDGLYDTNISDAFLISGEERIITTNKSEISGMQLNEGDLKPLVSGNVVDDTDSKLLEIYYEMPFSECSFLLNVEKSVVLQDLNQLRYFFLVFFLLSMVISLIPAYFLTKAMYRPIKDLTQTMGEISDGDLSKRADVTTKDEIGALSRDFNVMLDHINSLIEQLLEEELLKKDAELEALQYQITPHFMYNTLNSIKYAALLKGEKELGTLIGDFVELLQASINKLGTFITVADELHILDNYIHLQKVRYEGNFEVHYEVDAEAKGCFLPRLILQPMVENAILHGLDMKRETGQIVVRAGIDGDSLRLYVKDNGRGMTEEQMQKLLTGRVKKTSGLSGIGVSNVRDRLELYYGDKGGLYYENTGDGTVACIYLPAYREQNAYTTEKREGAKGDVQNNNSR